MMIFVPIVLFVLFSAAFLYLVVHVWNILACRWRLSDEVYGCNLDHYEIIDRSYAEISSLRAQLSALQRLYFESDDLDDLRLIERELATLHALQLPLVHRATAVLTLRDRLMGIRTRTYKRRSSIVTNRDSLRALENILGEVERGLFMYDGGVHEEYVKLVKRYHEILHDHIEGFVTQVTLDIANLNNRLYVLQKKLR
jgi:hypothetical protein